MTASSFQHLTVVGTGLIGGSFLMACREVYPDLFIRAVDKDSETLQYLVRAKLVDEVSLKLPAQWEENHLIVLAAHLRGNLEILERLAPQVAGKDVVVSDIGSCKRDIYAMGERLLPSQFIAGHPLAGKEVSGIKNAHGLLFVNKPYLFCPTARVATDAILAAHYERLRTFIETGLRCRLGEMTPDHHDYAMAFVSHFSHLYAVMLSNVLFRNEPGRLLQFHGAGIDDQLRLGASPYEVWREVFALNQDNIRTVIGEFRKILDEAETILDQPPMAAWFERANDLHQEFHEFRLQP